uniref:Uncharacterized protein n=1 Tax=Litorilinea aerophila TaxID=1204385 RepID=A0A540VIF4_9CHLR
MEQPAGLRRGCNRRHYLFIGRGVEAAAYASLPFAPKVVLPTLQSLNKLYPKALCQYGFKDVNTPQDRAKLRGSNLQTGADVPGDAVLHFV